MITASPLQISEGRSPRYSPRAPKTPFTNATSSSAPFATMRGVTLCQPSGTLILGTSSRRVVYGEVIRSDGDGIRAALRVAMEHRVGLEPTKSEVAARRLVPLRHPVRSSKKQKSGLAGRFSTRLCTCRGGKMDAKLPFDRPETIVKLGERLFTRIKDEAEREKIRRFLKAAELSEKSPRRRSSGAP